MPNVVKKDKMFEAFNPQKISASCLKAGATQQQAQEIADLITAQVNHTDMPTRLIRQAVIKELEKLNPEAAYNYTNHEKWAAQKIVVRNSYL
jgi:transcriptional regulator NrdR family protein